MGPYRTPAESGKRRILWGRVVRDVSIALLAAPVAIPLAAAFLAVAVAMSPLFALVYLLDSDTNEGERKPFTEWREEDPS